MILYISITVIVVLLAGFVNSNYRGQLNKVGTGMTASGTGKQGISGTGSPAGPRLNRQQMINMSVITGIFIILFVLSALRSGIGNDYWVYRYRFLDIARGDTKISYEIGFQLFVKLMQAIVGMDNYVPIFSVIAFVTLLFTLKGIYDTSDWFVITVFLYMTNGFYFMTFSNMRYYLALGMVLYAMKYVLSKKFVPFCCIILCAALFHMTALLVIPAYLVALYLKWGKKTYWLIPTVCVTLLAGSAVIRRIVFIFYPYYEGDLILDVRRLSVMNIAKCFAILVLALIYYKRVIKGNERAEFFFNLNLFALVLYTFASYIPEISRVCYYMVVGQIFLIPILLAGMKSRKEKIIWGSLIGVAYAGYFVAFLIKGYNPVIQILPYFSWYFS